MQTTTQRGYGWRWQKARLPFLSEHPLCMACQAQNIFTPAMVVDHIKPHKGDETLMWDRTNWQSLCKLCHDLKTITEDGGLNSGAMTHPEWLPKPACPVILVTGPSGAGKTTYCKTNAGPHDIIIDLDDCFTAVCGVHGHEADRAHLKQAIRYRNKMIASLITRMQGTAYLIVSSPSQKECAWWTAKLNAKHVLVDPGLAVCEQRVTGRRMEAARDWYAKARRNDWRHPAGHAKRATGADGWPV